ncbi:hypothetical protein JYK14_03340 [Siccirubricoccus sp. KC 17139]|uniref:ScoMcrA-like DNA sulfur-binding domain-containing protein n=1 Tax=Siccirubricoccus soli TaxID=2899147 RepID=A0ABT1D1M1_9PROT|nr:hypothetical protein [Siccirubricoccus soli]MCO6415210.1 hypothetical protein [Siccirubricoccus soli]MCP2681341.1 hypothetical protein [Siccirubricoccus soli]
MVKKPEDRATEFLEQLGKLRQFSAMGRRAPHKPLLLLYALAQLKHHGRDRVKYRDAERVLTPLPQTYGPTGTRARVADPFARLEGDGIWRIESENRDALFDSGGNARPGALSKHDAEAGFDDRTLSLLRDRPRTIDEAARVLLERNLPPQTHAEVLERVGLRLDDPA